MEWTYVFRLVQSLEEKYSSTSVLALYSEIFDMCACIVFMHSQDGCIGVLQ